MLLVAVGVGHELNLELASDLRGELSRSGFSVRTTGEDAQLLVSLHHEARAAGFSLFISRLNPHPWKSLRCASAIGAQLRAAGHAPSRYHADPALGAKGSPADPRNGVYFFDELGEARGAGMAAVVVEAGPIVGREERRGIASAISGGVRNCLR